MSVNAGDRKESKIEFDNTYFRVHDDAVLLIGNSFGADKDMRERHKNYIALSSKKILDIVMDIGTNIRIANSIYPTCKVELETRRLHQDIAIGLCYDLLTKYQLIMRTLKVSDNKYTVETQNLIHEINCLKKWRTSDNKRAKSFT